MRGFWFLVLATVRQGQVCGSALPAPLPACGCGGHISISQWCDAVAKDRGVRPDKSLETGFRTPPPTTVMISGQILWSLRKGLSNRLSPYWVSVGWSSKDPLSTQQMTLLRSQWLCLGTVTGRAWALSECASSVTLLKEVLTRFAILFLNDKFLIIKWLKVKVAQSCLTLCNPVDHTVHGILQARILEWVAFPFSRGSSQPRDWTQVSHIAGGFFTSWATREAL